MNHEWRNRAACAGVGDTVFFDPGYYTEALRFCRHCPVLTDCQTTNDQIETRYSRFFGVFGGETPKQRVNRRQSEAEAALKKKREAQQMARNRQSAKKAGTAFETLVAAYLNQHVDDRIERRRQAGVKDRGDIAGLRHMGQRLVVECKDYGGRLLAGPWLEEAAVERGNDDAGAGLVVAKRRGTTDPADQFVLMTLGDLVALLTGSRDHLEDQ